MIKNPLMEKHRKIGLDMRSARSSGYLELMLMDVIMDNHKIKHKKIIYKIWKQL